MSGGRTLRGASVVLVREGRVLLVRRAHPPFAGCWSFPGGRVEPGETEHEAALRELFEETGLDASLSGPFATQRIGPEDGDHWRVAVYLGLDPAGTLAADGDAADAGWFASDALAGLSLTPGASELAEMALELCATASPAPDFEAKLSE
jgi:8-oxo-dGTP diphosphatase